MMDECSIVGFIPYDQNFDVTINGDVSLCDKHIIFNSSISLVLEFLNNIFVGKPY